MKKHHFGLLFLACLFMTCAELQRMEVRNPSRSKPKTTPPPNTSTPAKAGKLPVFPVTGQSSKNIISYFGDGRDSGTRKHEGIDIGAPKGTTVLSVCDGEVKRVVEKGNGGRQVWVINSEETRTFYYAHLDKQLVKEGQKVKIGDILGTVGNTGNAAGGPPHLHFEVIDQAGKSMDSLPFMPI